MRVLVVSTSFCLGNRQVNYQEIDNDDLLLAGELYVE